MKKTLVLGAGLVSKPLVRYLLDQPDFHVHCASRTVSKAEKLIDGHERGKATPLDLTNPKALADLVPGADLVISLVPYAFHVQVAELCIQHKKLMVTTSYVSPAMKALDAKAKEAGVMILNEIGLDPGIDHMSAMRVFHDVRGRGGHIEEFMSYCGGLPAPEANTNPFGYKFSWSPRGVLLAGKNNASYLKDGERRDIPSKGLFEDRWTLDIQGEGEGYGKYQAYPNRDSIGYIDIYSLHKAKTVIRATLRNFGWCETLKAIVDLGFLDDEKRDLGGKTYGAVLAEMAGGSDPKKAVMKKLGIAADATPITNMAWLGLFGDEKIPFDKGSYLDALEKIMLEKMGYGPGERDMIVLHHRFTAGGFSDGHKEHITSTLIDFGIPKGDSAMSRTVGLPAAVATRYLLEGKIKGSGVHIPVSPEVYQPVLEELERLGIHCLEKSETV
ncbi:MAG: saccharopine dehydrogenase NADP-binding domain-containing protein [Candidatus Eisenbacteria bacterium]|nr:saccharopine dehydrogenase NADP-binding domain-containing protein [Candidatus Eisenbacteria bacterium]